MLMAKWLTVVSPLLKNHVNVTSVMNHMDP